MEEGLRSAALAAVVGEVGALAPTAGRRLQLACEASGATGFVLRRWRSGTAAERHRGVPSAAGTPWRGRALARPPDGSTPIRHRARPGAPSGWPGCADGILLEVTGCAHLQGGEARLAGDILARIGAPRQSGWGFAGRAAIADTSGAAWAVARFGAAGHAVIAPGAARAALADLPVAALRLPAES